MAALKYREVKDLYDELKEAGVTTASMPEWARRMDAATKGDTFSAGLSDNPLKRFSASLDTGLEHFASSKNDAVMRLLGTPEEGYNVPESVASLVSKIFTDFGASPETTEMATDIGRGLPRMTVNMLPMLAGGVGGLLGMAGLTGAEAYTESDSPAAGLISAATAAAMPGVARLGEQQVLKRIGGKLVEGPLATSTGVVKENFRQFFPSTIGQGIKSQVAGQVAASGFGEVSRAVEAGFTEDDPENPRSTYRLSPTEQLLNMTLGQLPFGAVYLSKTGRSTLGGRTTEQLIRNIEADITKSRQNIEVADARRKLEEKSPIEKIPVVEQPIEIDPQVVRERQSLLAQLRGQQIKLRDDPNLSPEDRLEQQNRILREETVLLRERESLPTSPTSIFGDSIAPDGPREQIVGRELKSTGRWRAVLVEDMPVNPPELRGKVVSYSTVYEPNPTKRSDGTTVFGLPDVQWRTIKSQDEWNSRYPKRGDGTPELPVQEIEATREQIFSHLVDLQRVENDVGQANTTGDLHQAVTRLNSVQEDAGLPTTNDASLRKTAKVLQESGLVDPANVAKAAVAVEAKKTARKLTTRETERAVPPLTEDEAATVAAQMGETQEGKRGFSVITADKLSHTKEVVGDDSLETRPNRDLVTETAIRVSLSDDGQTAFNKWERKGETTLQQEQQMFYYLTDEFGTIADVTPDEGAQVLSERMGMDLVEAKDEVQDFLQRPHVKVWATQLEGEIRRMRTGNAAPQLAVPRLPAGQDWLFSIGDYNPTTNVLNQKHKLPRDGVLREATFRNMAGVGKPLTEVEMELYRTIVPEAFDGEGNVRVPTLWKGLKEKGPVVEVKKLSGGQYSETAQAIHRLDTEWPQWRNAEENEAPTPELYQMALDVLDHEEMGTPHPTGGARYPSVSPKPESEMQGYVEGLVRVPEKNDVMARTIREYGTEDDPDYETPYNQYSPATREARGIQYQGPHFGSEDTNVLAFFRGYEETLPDGTKAFHVIEVQSDWGQAQRKTQDRIEQHGRVGVVPPADHPLLRVYEPLALKAAIRHAKEVGATKVILSDAETAMMTEGHDRAAAQLREANERQQIPQEKGMRLHYDQTLSSAMEKLTGVRGEVVELGTHKMAGQPDLETTNDLRDTSGPKGSPVFRDPSGNPKTQITGRIYDISQAPEAFTLTEKARAPYIPDESEQPRFNELGLGEGGEGLRRFLSTDREHSALAKDLAKFGASLSRVSVRVDEDEIAAAARNLGNGQVEIVFNPAILYTSNPGHYIAHELIHGLTLTELDNPTKRPLFDEMTKLRERLIEALPKDQRTAYDKAVKDDWYRKYSDGLVGFDTLYPQDQSKGLVIYGLLTNQELVAQGFSEPRMRVFMQSVKGEGQTWFHRFTNIIKRLVGLGDHIPDSAFEEFLSRSDALLQHGEHVSSFQNYANRYFENLGMRQDLVNAQTRRALALVMDSVNGTTPEAIFASLQQQQNTKANAEFVRATRDVGNMMRERGEDFEIFSSVMDELGHNVDMRGLNDFAYEALVTGENLDAVDLLPDSAARYLFAQAKDMHEVVGVLKAATSDKNKGLINLTDSKGLRLPVGEAMKRLEKILETSKMHDLAVEQVQGLYAIAPDGYLEKTISDPVRAPEWIEGADRTKPKVSWIKNWLQPIAQWAREDPRVGELTAKGFQLASNSRKMASEGLKVFGIDADQLGKGNVLSKQAVDRMEKIFKSPKLVKAVNDWMFLNQKAGQESGTTRVRPASDPEVAKVLSKLSQEERSQVHEIIAKQQISMQVMHAQQLEKMLQIAASDGAVLVGSDTGLKANQNVQLAEALLKATVVDRNNPLEVSAYMKEHGTDMDTQVALVQQRLEPEVFNRLLKYSLNEAEKYNAWKQFFAENPAWASGQRYGKYLVEYRRGNRTFSAGVESRKEAEALAEGGKITKFESNRKYDEDSAPNLGPDAIGMITRLRELEENRINMLKDKMTPEQIEELRRLSPVEQLATEEAYRGGVPGLRPPPRGLTKGAEELPWLSNHFSWVQKTSSFWSRQLLRAQARAHLLDPEIAADREVQKRLKTHVDNILADDPELVAKLSRFTTTWFMGYNPASALVNGTQSFVTHVSEFTALTGKPLESYRRVLAAMSELRDAKVGRKGFRGDEHEKLMKHAAEDGEIDYSMYDVDAAAQDSIATNYKRILNGHRTQTIGQHIGTAAGAYTKAGMWMFRGVEKFNNQLALIASFDYYREQGLGFDDAKAKAYEFNRTVNFGGGRAQRPVGLFSGRAPLARGAAVTASSLQNYTLGVTFQIARHIQRGFFRPEGVTPAERHNARIAATQMLATQLAAAGVLGLPFASGAIALLDTAFPALELNKNLREFVTSLFSSDEENGSVLSDIAMTGVPSMFGWDLQSRLTMGNTVPGVSEVNGFQPELLAGPPANLIGQFVSGGTKLATGDLSGLRSFVPATLKKVTQVAASGGTIKDYRNRPVFEPTVGETAGLVLGFQPKQLSDYNTAARIAEQSQTVERRRVGQHRQGLAEQVLKGEFGTVRQEILAQAQDDKTRNPLEEVHAIARAAEELTFPRDLRREGTRATSSEREKLLRSFNLPPNQVSEVQRVQFRWEIQRRLGAPAGSKSELQRAQLIDQLRSQHPDATRAGLSRQADLLLRGAGRTLQEPLE